MAYCKKTTAHNLENQYVERPIDKKKRERWELHLKTCQVCAAAKRDLEYLKQLKEVKLF